jgi:putative two-component system response regulator
MLERIIADGLYADTVAAFDMNFFVPAAQLHDIGKLLIPDDILLKPAALTAEEFTVVKRHTTNGAAIIDRMTRASGAHVFLKYARVFADTHHEHWDGTGYPAGLAGAAIPLAGRLLAIADVYDALVTGRPYKEAIPPAQAETIIAEGKATQFDPALVDVFQKTAPRFAAAAAAANAGAAPA